MFCEYDHNNIVVYRYSDEMPVSCAQVLETLAYSTIDFIDLCNDGCPVNYGNSYASYDFVAYAHDPFGKYRYTFGPMELEALQNSDSVALAPIEPVVDEYALIIFVEDSETLETVEAYYNDSPEKAIEYLSQWDYGTESETDISTAGDLKKARFEDWYFSSVLDDEYLLIRSCMGYFALYRRLAY